MIKMDMTWIVVAKSIHSGQATSMSASEIIRGVQEEFGEKIHHAMIGNLTGSKDRQAKKSYRPSGGSRNRYLSEESKGRFRLYKETDGPRDGKDKIRRSCPRPDALPQEYHYLVEWYKSEYFPS